MNFEGYSITTRQAWTWATLVSDSNVQNIFLN